MTSNDYVQCYGRIAPYTIHILFLLVLQFAFFANCLTPLRTATSNGARSKSWSRPAGLRPGSVSLRSWWYRSAPQQGHRPRILQSEQGRFFLHRSSACQLGQDKLWWCTSVLWHDMAVWASGKRCLRIEKYILKQWQTQRIKDSFQLFAPLIWKQNERENVWEYRLEAKPGQNWSPFSPVSRAVWLSTCRVQRPVKNIFLPVINEADVASSQKQPARPTIYSLPHNKNRRLYHQPQCLEVQYSLVTNRFGWVKRNKCTRAENGWNTYECVNLYPCIRCVGTMYGDCTLVYPQAKTCLWSLLFMFVAAPKRVKRIGKNTSSYLLPRALHRAFPLQCLAQGIIKCTVFSILYMAFEMSKPHLSAESQQGLYSCKGARRYWALAHLGCLHSDMWKWMTRHRRHRCMQ